MEKVFARCHEAILGAIRGSSLQATLPPEFLGALTANESGGNAKAARFEPAVYGHLRDVADGKARVFPASAGKSGISPAELDAEIEEMLHPKDGGYHARCLTGAFAETHAAALAALEDEALRELATSWGYTQIMGYHMVGRVGVVRDLLDPEFNFRLAVELLGDFAHEFELDPATEFEPMFRCWNTGRPYGETFAPEYVRKGLERMRIYAELGIERMKTGQSVNHPITRSLNSGGLKDE